MGGIAARRKFVNGFFTDDNQAGGVALMDDQIGEGRDQAFGEIKTAFPFVGETHRRAAIENEIGTEVCFRLKLLHVKAVGAREHAPVEPADVVAGRVVAILGELDAGAAMRTLVATGDAAFHWAAGAEFEPGKPGKDGRVEEFALNGRGHA